MRTQSPAQQGTAQFRFSSAFSLCWGSDALRPAPERQRQLQGNMLVMRMRSEKVGHDKIQACSALSITGRMKVQGQEYPWQVSCCIQRPHQGISCISCRWEMFLAFSSQAWLGRVSCTDSKRKSPLLEWCDVITQWAGQRDNNVCGQQPRHAGKESRANI